MEIFLMHLYTPSLFDVYIQWHEAAKKGNSNSENEGVILQTSLIMKISFSISFAVRHVASSLLSTPSLCQVRGAQQQFAAGSARLQKKGINKWVKGLLRRARRVLRQVQLKGAQLESVCLNNRKLTKRSKLATEQPQTKTLTSLSHSKSRCNCVFARVSVCAFVLLFLCD